jgi:hypothetical protein
MISNGATQWHTIARIDTLSIFTTHHEAGLARRQVANGRKAYRLGGVLFVWGGFRSQCVSGPQSGFSYMYQPTNQSPWLVCHHVRTSKPPKKRRENATQ